MVETICHSSQTVEGRTCLFSLNWEAITQDTWVIQTVTEGYHTPLMSILNQYCSSQPLQGEMTMAKVDLNGAL